MCTYGTTCITGEHCTNSLVVPMIAAHDKVHLPNYALTSKFKIKYVYSVHVLIRTLAIKQVLGFILQ